MGFTRAFDITKPSKLKGQHIETYARLKTDIFAGKVFPAVRKGELHFYYKGGNLFQWVGNKFHRDNSYSNYNPPNAEELNYYDLAKAQCKIRYGGKTKGENDEAAQERQMLDNLNRHTFSTDPKDKSDIVVLDIEVRLNGNECGNKKCDMVLLNKNTSQIVFVEGKVFSDYRVNSRSTPEVIGQVNAYTRAITEQLPMIIEQYEIYIDIVNELFKSDNNRPINLTKPISLIDKAKLLVYETPEIPRENGRRCIEEIEDEKKGLGKTNVLWHKKGKKPPTIAEIWEALAERGDCKNADKNT